MKRLNDPQHSEPVLVLDDDDQITFVTDSGAQYDLAAKSWGAYLTPSLRGRLARFGLRPCLIIDSRRRSLALVEIERLDQFEADAAHRGVGLIWLDQPFVKDDV